MKRPAMTFTATGDSFITRRLPTRSAESFEQISSFLKQAEVRFTNLEVTAHRFEGYPSAFSGGTWAIAPPEVLDDIKDYGFNLIAWPNNHTLDYSHGGLLATKKYLDQSGFVHAGVGENMAEASRPKYLECPSGRVALIAATSTFHESWIAGEQRPDMMGRPGVNPLRYKTVNIVSKNQLDQLKSIASCTDINADLELAIKEGFEVASDSDLFRLGNHWFKEGSQPGTITEPLEKDVRRIHKMIEEAKRQADYVIVSLHSHEMKGKDKAKPGDFMVEFARSCIDQGAHAVIGHGPHVLRGIEIYKKRPIFYSLGNFIFQNETVALLPSDFYEQYGLSHEQNPADALDTRTENNTKGLGVNRYVWESVIPYWKMEDGELTELTLHPIELGFGLPRYERGWPKLSSNTTILEHLQALSAPFGTKIEISGSKGMIRLAQ